MVKHWRCRVRLHAGNACATPKRLVPRMLKCAEQQELRWRSRRSSTMVG